MGSLARGVVPVCGLLVAMAIGCGRKPSPGPPPTSGKRDAAVLDAIGVDASDLKERLSELPAPYPPPPPVKRNHAHGDCRTEYAPRPDRDPVPMCRVQGGSFMMGGGKYAPAPAQQTTVQDFYIDQFEVTIQQAVLFLNAHGNQCPGLDKSDQDPRSPYAYECVHHGVNADIEGSAPFLDGILERGGRFVVRPGYALKPEIDFSFEGAMRYCEWVGKTVPSSAHWEYAARHDPVSNKDLTYPWGDTWLSNHAACRACAGEHQPELQLTVGMFDGTGGRADGSSPWGVHDMTGGGPELVFACAAPDETCRPGSACSCDTLEAISDREDVAALATSARFQLRIMGNQGVRCARSAAASPTP